MGFMVFSNIAVNTYKGNTTKNFYVRLGVKDDI